MKVHPREQLELAREDALSGAERAALSAHLAECADCRAYAAELERNDALLARREPRLAPPPLGSRRRPGFAWGGVAAAVVAALVVVTALGVAREQAARPPITPPTQLPSRTADPSLSPGMTASPSPTPVSTGEPPETTGLTAHALGPLGGDWVFVFKKAQAAGFSVTELWGIPLAGGEPRLALSFRKSRGGAPEGLIEFSPYLRRAFSPDGKRVVVSTDKQLVVVDLETGRARGMGVAGEFASWSRAGNEIAFLRSEPNPDPQIINPVTAIWVVGADGSPARKVANGFGPLEWSNDPARLLASGIDTYLLLNTTDGSLVGRVASEAAGGRSPAFWRRGSSEVALVVRTQGEGQLVIHDISTGARRVLLRSAAGTYEDPRWNPVTGEVLVLERPDRRTGDLGELHIVDAGGRDSTLALNAWEATWTPDGKGVAYIEGGQPPLAPIAVRVRDGTSGTVRDLMRATDRDESFMSIASLGY